MSKIKISITTIAMFMLLSMFSAVAFAAAPGVATDIKLTPVSGTSTQAVISWKGPSYGEPAVDYNLQWVEYKVDAENKDISDVYPTAVKVVGATNKTITGLIPGKKYKIKIVAISGTNEVSSRNAEAKDLSFTGSYTKVSSIPGADSVSIQLTKEATATSYSFKWGEEAPETITPIGTDPIAPIVKENLVPGQAYPYTVTTTYGDGVSSSKSWKVTLRVAPKKDGDTVKGIKSGTVKNDGTETTHRVHGDFQNNTNACANCHSTHAGSDEHGFLLKYGDGEYDTCIACHDGTMGFYDVNAKSESIGVGIFNSNNGSPSMHDVNGDVAIGSAPGTSSTSSDHFTCSSCHNPHGSVNDRLLTTKIFNNPWYYNSSNVYDTDAEAKTTKRIKLTSTAVSGLNLNNVIAITKTTGFVDNPSIDAYSKFCVGCHDNYKEARATGYTDKDGQKLHSHTAVGSSAGRNCASCHFAHGSDVTLLLDTNGRTIEDLEYTNGSVNPKTGKTGLGWTSDKALKYMNDISDKGSQLKKYTNMAVCWSCHYNTSHAIDSPLPSGAGTFQPPAK